MVLVNDARAAYASMHTQAKVPEGYGLRQAVWQASVYAGQEKGFDAYLSTLNGQMASLNTPVTGAAQATLRSRVLADLAVLAYFSKAHESDVKTVLKERGEGTFEAFGELYDEKKAESSIYEHRLGSILR